MAKKDKKKSNKMGIKIASLIQVAFYKKKKIFLTIENIRRMVRIPSEANTEIYGICLRKEDGEEVLYLAKVFRKVTGSIKKVNVTDFYDARELAGKYCEEKEKGE